MICTRSVGLLYCSLQSVRRHYLLHLRSQVNSLTVHNCGCKVGHQTKHRRHVCTRNGVHVGFKLSKHVN
jgi:hypothetical protein